MQQILKRTAIAALAVVLIAVAWLSIVPPDSQYSLRYLWWKHGNGPYDDAFHGAVINDRSLERWVVGRSQKELIEKLDGLNPAKTSNRTQRYYLQFLHGFDVYWLGESTIAFKFKSGRLDSMELCKG